MAISRLGVSGFPRPPYGSFAGKTAAPIVRDQYTRLGVSGFPRPPYGSFAGKVEAAPVLRVGHYTGFLANVNRLRGKRTTT